MCVSCHCHFWAVFLGGWDSSLTWSQLVNTRGGGTKKLGKFRDIPFRVETVQFSTHVYWDLFFECEWSVSIFSRHDLLLLPWKDPVANMMLFQQWGFQSLSFCAFEVWFWPEIDDNPAIGTFMCAWLGRVTLLFTLNFLGLLCLFVSQKAVSEWWMRMQLQAASDVVDLNLEAIYEVHLSMHLRASQCQISGRRLLQSIAAQHISGLESATVCMTIPVFSWSNDHR